MKKCPHCGVSQQDDALFCDACGNPFPVHKSKPGLSRLCLAGFISSTAAILATVYIVVYLCNYKDIDSTILTVLFDCSFLVAVLCSLAGFILSVLGVARARKKKQKGIAFGIIGIVESVVDTIVTVIIAFVCAAVVALLLILASSFSAVSHDPPETVSPWLTETTEDTFVYETDTETEKRTMTFGTGPETINLWSYTDEVPKMVGQYIKQYPEFGEKYTVECTIIATDGGAYQRALDNALDTGGDAAPDIYTAEEAFIYKYSKGDMSVFASTYKDLGIDVDAKIKEADIAEYSVEIGTRDGQVVALGYQGTGSVMIYNADVAKDVFGTDDPAQIEMIVGAGSGNWDMFFEAAAALKAKGYAAVSGPSDLWHACEQSADKGWVVDGQLTIDPKRKKYLDIAKVFKDNEWSNNTHPWSEAWYTDMKGEGEKKVFAYFGPAWLINYVMRGCSGGNRTGEGTYGQWRVCAPPVGFYWSGTWLLANKDTDNKEGVAELLEWITLDCSDTGLQYLWANGLVDWDNDPSTTTAIDAVTSATVMAKSDGTLEFCGGQNIYPAIIMGNKYASAKAMTQYDENINGYWTYCVEKYVDGTYSREEAIEEFKKLVKDNITF